MFRELSEIFYGNVCIVEKSYFLWEFQAETLYVCPNPWFRRTYKNFQLQILTINVISVIVYFSRDYFGELVER